MASLADAEEALRSTDAKSNFQRITRLLMSGGVTLFREKLDSIHSPTNLPITLSYPAVQKLLRKARITTPEWNCLYPSPGVYGKSSDFDITLTFRLLRTICNLSPPHTGWDNLPNDSDHSPEAELARIKWYRNKVYSHSQNMEIPHSEFVDLWREISEALLRIAVSISHEKGNNWKKAIEKFLLEPLTPEAERYAEELTLWYEKDVDIKRAILRLENTIERFIQCGLVVNPMETHDNQQERPAEIDIWNVIMAFQNSFNLLFEYLENKLNVFVQHFELGSLSIIVECSSLQILEGLWTDYSSGHLNKVAQETLITDEVLKKLGLDDVKLKTFISEKEYEKGKQIFSENSEPSEKSRVLEREAVCRIRDHVEKQETGLATPIEKEKHAKRIQTKEESYREILQKHTVGLTEKLEPEPLTLYLYGNNIISDRDRMDILSKETRYEKNEALLSKLRRKGPEAFTELVKGLEEEQPSVACILLREENKRLSYKLAEIERRLTERKHEDAKQKRKIKELQNDNLSKKNQLKRAESEIKELTDANFRIKSNQRQKLPPLLTKSAPVPVWTQHWLFPFTEEKQIVTKTMPQASTTSPRLRSDLLLSEKSLPTTCRIYHYNYESDFDERGVIYYLGARAGPNKITWVNPARVPSSGVKVTSSPDSRGDPENILEYYNPVNSYTKSGWCVDLGEKYTLSLTCYTLRQMGINDKNFLQNWELLGRLHSNDDWCLLERHDKVDWSTQRFSYIVSEKKNVPCKTKTWFMQGKARACRYFKIVRITGKSYAPSIHDMSLAGIELYGVLCKSKLG